MKPTLKKVSKYENKFAKLQKKVFVIFQWLEKGKESKTILGGRVQLPEPAENGGYFSKKIGATFKLVFQVKKKEFAMKEEEEKTKKKPNWALQVTPCHNLWNVDQGEFLQFLCHRNFPYMALWNIATISTFNVQNSLSTVSLGKLGEEGGEDGLEVEEE